MDQQDAWTLFFATGLPQAYLMARELENHTVPSPTGMGPYSAPGPGKPTTDGGPLLP